MARRVFFSFDFEHDVFRANQVRNANVVGVERAGYYDHSEYEEARKKGSEAIARMIRGHLENTTVTVVLIGTRTAYRLWVRYEIAESIKRGNGLLGVLIYHLAAPPTWRPGAPRTLWEASPPGPKPAVPEGIPFPVYAWDYDLDRFRRVVEAAGKRSDAIDSARREGQRRALRALFVPPPPALAVSPPRLSSLRVQLSRGAPSFAEIVERARRKRAIERALFPEPSSLEEVLGRMMRRGRR